MAFKLCLFPNPLKWKLVISLQKQGFDYRESFSFFFRLQTISPKRCYHFFVSKAALVRDK